MQKERELQKTSVCTPSPKMSRWWLAKNFLEKDEGMLEYKLYCQPCPRREVD